MNEITNPAHHAVCPEIIMLGCENDPIEQKTFLYEKGDANRKYNNKGTNDVPSQFFKMIEE